MAAVDNPLEFKKLKEFWKESLHWDSDQIRITQVSGGFSNLTFLVESPIGKFAMRRAPFGDKISKAHDMVRECQVLEALYKAGYKKAPKPVVIYEDEELSGTPLLLMEWVEGYVLRNKIPKGIQLNPEDFRKLSENTLDSLLELHQLELEESGLHRLGKAEGYVKRQIDGWIDRYLRAKTDSIPEMVQVATWLQSNLPNTENIGFIHNDFKYDNLVLNLQNVSEINAVLDWEMATVGDPLMDLGTSLAYWAEPGDPDILKMFGLTYLSGNLTRAEVIDYYAQRSPLDLSNMLFYYVFGLYKVAVIAQQIYKRYAQGFAKDQRFAELIFVVKAAGQKALESIKSGKI